MADISLNYGEKKKLLEIEAKKGHRVEQGKKQPRIPTADNEHDDNTIIQNWLQGNIVHKNWASTADKSLSVGT